jgi:hypothetical protein
LTLNTSIVALKMRQQLGDLADGSTLAWIGWNEAPIGETENEALAQGLQSYSMRKLKDSVRARQEGDEAAISTLIPRSELSLQAVGRDNSPVRLEGIDHGGKRAIGQFSF